MLHLYNIIEINKTQKNTICNSPRLHHNAHMRTPNDHCCV